MYQSVKLTLRLPPSLHERLKRRARQMDWSLNATIIETLKDGLESESPQVKSPRERALHMLREHGLIEEPGTAWSKYAEEGAEITHAELREMLKHVPPLSEAIIQEREPR